MDSRKTYGTSSLCSCCFGTLTTGLERFDNGADAEVEVSERDSKKKLEANVSFSIPLSADGSKTIGFSFPSRPFIARRNHQAYLSIYKYWS